MGITIGGLNLEYSATKFKDRNIEGTAAKVVHCNLHILVLLVKAIGKSCSCRLVDNTLYIKTCNLTGLFGSLTLRVGEICRNSYNCLSDILTEIILCSLFHLLENHCRYLLRGVKLTIDIDTRSIVFSADHLIRHTSYFSRNLVEGFTHESLDRENGVVRIGDCLTLSRISDLTLASVSECNYRRSCTLTLIIDDYGRLVAFHYGYTRISGAEVNSDNFSHDIVLFYCFSK